MVKLSDVHMDLERDIADFLGMTPLAHATQRGRKGIAMMIQDHIKGRST